MHKWLDKFKSILSNVSTQPIQVKAEKAGRFSLNNNQTFQPEPNTNFWVKMQQGYLRLLGREELTLTTADVVMPINDAIWLSADGAVQLTAETYETVADGQTLVAGLSQLHKLFLTYVRFQAKEE